MDTCEWCHAILIEIDNYGHPLIGCYKWNKWRQPGEVNFVRELLEADIAALRQIDAEETPKTNGLVEIYAAKKNAEAMESYTARGRAHQALSDTELAEKFREGVRQWAANLKGTNQLLNDVCAEYELREPNARA
jgi:hypothetical protein